MSFTDSSHWYDRLGNPAYTVPYMDPKRAGESKPTSLADAKRLGLLPSVTTVLKAKAPSYGLQKYQYNRIVEACWEHRLSNLELEQWRGMVLEDASSPMRAAADEGSQYHLVVESIVKNEDLPDYELTIPVEFFTSFARWWKDSGLVCDHTEVSFAHPLGYGGRIDLIGHDRDGNDVILDWKTQDTKPDRPAGFYRDSFPIQLRAYAEGYASRSGKDLTCPRLISVVLSRSEPGRIEMMEWPSEEHGTYWRAFLGLFDWWKYENNYWPEVTP